MKTSPKSVVICLVFATLLSGCETIERETGFNRDTQKGALSGAAIGGVVSGLAGASPAGIAASVILGGVAGGYIGNALGKKDAEKHAQTNLRALDTLGAGQSERWSDSSSGNSGSTSVTKVTKRSDGTICKTYVETVHAGSQTVTKDATACRTSNGTWKIGDV